MGVNKKDSDSYRSAIPVISTFLQDNFDYHAGEGTCYYLINLTIDGRDFFDYCKTSNDDFSNILFL